MEFSIRYPACRPYVVLGVTLVGKPSQFILVILCLSLRSYMAKNTHGRTHPIDPKCEDPNASEAPSYRRRIGFGESSDWKRVFPLSHYTLREG